MYATYVLHVWSVGVRGASRVICVTHAKRVLQCKVRIVHTHTCPFSSQLIYVMQVLLMCNACRLNPFVQICMRHLMYCIHCMRCMPCTLCKSCAHACHIGCVQCVHDVYHACNLYIVYVCVRHSHAMCALYVTCIYSFIVMYLQCPSACDTPCNTCIVPNACMFVCHVCKACAYACHIP